MRQHIVANQIQQKAEHGYLPTIGRRDERLEQVLNGRSFRNQRVGAGGDERDPRPRHPSELNDQAAVMMPTTIHAAVW